MKFKNLICDSNHSSLTLCETYTLLNFWLLYHLLHVPPLCWLLLVGLSLSSAVQSPGLSLQTFFFPELLTWWSHTVSVVNISRLLIPNFYLMYTYKMYTTDWAVPQINMSRTDMISHPPSLALKVFLILVLSISLRHFFSFSNS